MKNNLPELDRRKTQTALEGVFEKYRIYKTITFMDRESFITAGYTDRPNGPTNVTSDPTARTAVYNVDAPAARLAYCEMVDAVVSRLNEREQLLIRERYLKDDDVFDYKVYNYVLDPPVSKDTYTKLRTRAFYKMALALADQGVVNLAGLQKGADRKLG